MKMKLTYQTDNQSVITSSDPTLVSFSSLSVGICTFMFLSLVRIGCYVITMTESMVCFNIQFQQHLSLTVGVPGKCMQTCSDYSTNTLSFKPSVHVHAENNPVISSTLRLSIKLCTQIFMQYIRNSEVVIIVHHHLMSLHMVHLCQLCQTIIQHVNSSFIHKFNLQYLLETTVITGTCSEFRLVICLFL